MINAFSSYEIPTALQPQTFVYSLDTSYDYAHGIVCGGIFASW